MIGNVLKCNILKKKKNYVLNKIDINMEQLNVLFYFDFFFVVSGIVILVSVYWVYMDFYQELRIL